MKALVLVYLLAASLGTRLASAADTALCTTGGSINGTTTVAAGTSTVTGCALEDQLTFEFTDAAASKQALRISGGSATGASVYFTFDSTAPVDVAITGVKFVDSGIMFSGSLLPSGSSLAISGCSYTYTPTSGVIMGSHSFSAASSSPDLNQFYVTAVEGSTISFVDNVAEISFNTYLNTFYVDGTNFTSSAVSFERNRVAGNVTEGIKFYGLYVYDIHACDLSIDFHDNTLVAASEAFYFYRNTLEGCNECLGGKITLKATGNTIEASDYAFEVYDYLGNTDATFRDNTATCNPDSNWYSDIEVYHYHGATLVDPLRIDVSSNEFNNCEHNELYFYIPALPDGSALTVTGNHFNKPSNADYVAVYFQGGYSFSNESAIAFAGNVLTSDATPENYGEKMFGFYMGAIAPEERSQYGSIALCNNRFLGTTYPLENATAYVYLEDASTELLFTDKCSYQTSAAPAGRAALPAAAAALAALAAAFLAVVA